MWVLATSIPIFCNKTLFISKIIVYIIHFVNIHNYIMRQHLVQQQQLRYNYVLATKKIILKDIVLFGILLISKKKDEN